MIDVFFNDFNGGYAFLIRLDLMFSILLWKDFKNAWERGKICIWSIENASQKEARALENDTRSVSMVNM